MMFLKVITKDGELEYLNAKNILSIQPLKNGDNVKILMGAGLYWIVKADSMELISLEEII